MTFPTTYLIYCCTTIIAFVGKLHYIDTHMIHCSDTWCPAFKLIFGHSYITQLFSAPFTLIGFINRQKLYCTSEDLLESFQDETTYCTAGGTYNMLSIIKISIILVYVHLQAFFSLMVWHNWDTGWLFMPLASAGQSSFHFTFEG